MLGRISDAKVAEATGRGRRHIRTKRESLGIAPFQQQNKSQWSKKMLSKLGKAPDGQVAEELGVALSTVSVQRHRHGIPAFVSSKKAKKSPSKKR